ncbi:nucleotide-diphospho-sugar transferase [Aureobasidium subglaciale]|nr:nucleotide-diphospho-sugar transferase [Aureobasidium subglaciale]KAI5217230.1 nucleotide-diphospho-sugar transferase [Aureobasidium subglaciale]KAI5254985.1 nucleotide-diphospho-sugar transferase [Aureobasidium subglaciale]
MRVTFRFALRFVGVVALISILVLSFSQSTIAYKALNDRLSTLKTPSTSRLPTINNTQPVNSVHELWHIWAEVYKDTRPNARKIELMFNAANVPVSADDSSPRTQHTQHLQALDSIQALQAAHSKFLAILQSWPEQLADSVFNGTGVVIVGGGEYFGPAIIGIHMLRRSGSNLPVQVFVADKSEYEDSLCKDYLPKLGAECLILAEVVQGFKVTHYQLKSLAMLLSSFENVLYLDSDSIPLLDPEIEVFAAEPYTSNGLVIWPDFWISTESPSFYTVVGLGKMPPDLPKSSSEAGQLGINKRKHLKTLLLANYYNIYGPDYYYPLLSQGALGQGDKETFMAAAMVLDAPYYRVKTGVTSVSRSDGSQNKGSGMVQVNPSDDLRRHGGDVSEKVRPAFLHANTPKMNAAHLVDEGDLSNVVNHKPLRLWGPRDEQIRGFGMDLEKAVWELVVQTGCELADKIREWSDCKDLCRRLNEHWDGVFKDSA